MKRLYLCLLSVLLISFLTPSYGVEFKVNTHPRLLVNDECVELVREKIEKYEWAAENSRSLIEKADRFKVPARRDFTVRRGSKSWKSLGYTPAQIEELFTVGLAWMLTDNSDYLAKLKGFVLDVCDPELGYVKVGAATTGVEVHEGGFFFFFAAICDILYSEENVFTAEQKSQIENVMRTYLESSKDNMAPNGIMNHQASSNSAAVLVSMFLQDEAYFDHFVNGAGGMMDHLAIGVMPDGWWFEATVNYCYLVTEIYFRMAQVFQNNGLDLYDMKIPSKPMDKDFHNAPDGYTGMKFAVWGPEPKPYRTLRDMAMAYFPMMDENGVVLASNDSGTVAPSEFYELAYKEFKNKELAWAISKTKRDSWIALFYGEGKLPKVNDPRTKSAYVENVGLTALRAQGKKSVGEEQLQAYMKYGSHGGWHGHYDRTSLQALDKYGHKFFGTEMCWFGYISAQYKELVQTSVTHNMVVVDQMQQEAVPSEQPLFYAGRNMQLSVTQSVARWRPIPLNNPDKFPPWNDFDFETEPITQRRLAMVTDDYLLMADYLMSEESRTYDYLLHPVGFRGVEGAERTGDVLAKMTNDQTSPYKYFTNSQWYLGANEEVKFSFCDNGVGLDLHAVSPKNLDCMVAHYPTTGKLNGFKNNPDRRTVALRSKGCDVVFITLLEPYKDESLIEKVESVSDDEVNVIYKDGSVHTIYIYDLKGDDPSQIKVELRITNPEGKVTRERN